MLAKEGAAQQAAHKQPEEREEPAAARGPQRSYLQKDLTERLSAVVLETSAAAGFLAPRALHDVRLRLHTEDELFSVKHLTGHVFFTPASYQGLEGF